MVQRSNMMHCNNCWVGSRWVSTGSNWVEKQIYFQLLKEYPMNFETLMKDVQKQVEPIVEQGQELLEQGQEVVLAGFETLKTANGIVVDGVQTLVKTQVEAGKDLFEAAQTSFEKAMTDGIKAVAADPISYLPEGKERVVSAYNDSIVVVTKTGDKLAKTFKSGYKTISAKINGKPVPAKRKTTRRAAATAAA
jgi:hypothetical protein